MTFEKEIVHHTCAHCDSTTCYFFSIDLKYKVEPPFLCSEDCYEQYALSQLRDDSLNEDDLYDETYDL